MVIQERKQHQHWLEIVCMVFLCAFIQRTQAHAPPPPGHSQVEDPEHPIDSHYTVFLSVVRGVWPSIFKEVLLQWLHRGWYLSCPRGACTHTHPNSVTGLGQSLQLSSSHPSWAWYLNSGHHQKWLQSYGPPIGADEGCDTTAGCPAKPIEGHEVKTHHHISHRHAKVWACRSLTSHPNLRTPNPLWTADCPFEGAEEITHEDLPLPVGPRIAFKPGFIMPLEEGKSYFQMEDSSHAAHSRGKVWTNCCWKENLEIIKNFSLNLKSISIFPFLSQTASRTEPELDIKSNLQKTEIVFPAELCLEKKKQLLSAVHFLQLQLEP